MPEFIWKTNTIHYEDIGSGPLLMLFPGNTASSAHYNEAITHWASNYRVICPDLLGTGQSSRLTTWPVDWWEENARMATALLNHLNCPDYIAAGSSGGGIIALLMAILHPQKMQAVVTDSTVYTWQSGQLADIVNQRHDPDKGTRQFWQYGHGDDWQEVIEADGKMLLAFASQGGDWAQRRLSEITCPVLLTGSLHDELLPQIGESSLQMAADIPNCQIYLTNSGGHALIWTAHNAFCNIVDLFLKSV